MLHFLIKQKVRFQRGQTWIQIMNFVMLLFLTMREMNTWIGYILLGVVGTIFGMWLIGYTDQRFKFQQKESEYVTSTINPSFRRIEEKIDEILRRQNELTK